ncbi:hypothetical protein [Bradyrhizobium iriomotense]|uniref:hypothetical protein n=1 Tax=Bradyrhizobium iriomotense TaxID=441950 RepID=UPI001B8A4260|nr:hypothetical protein [Bradyrhizobium iriomotense]MBR0782474.1 hypothetical protein [Bradyrhizobium iriomotense]
MKHSVRAVIACIVLMVVLMPGLAARANEQFTLLDGKQIRARIVGKDITDGPHWSMYLRPDGALVSSEAGSSWTSSWAIRNDKLCISSPGSTSLECNEVWVSGANVRMRANKDQKALEAIVAVHRSN